MHACHGSGLQVWTEDAGIVGQEDSKSEVERGWQELGQMLVQMGLLKLSAAGLDVEFGIQDSQAK